MQFEDIFMHTSTVRKSSQVKIKTFLFSILLALSTTPLFPPDHLLFVWCSLSDDHQSQMSHQISVNSHQTSVRQVPHIHWSDMYHTSTRHILYHIHQMSTRHIPDIHMTSVRYMAHVWCKCGTCLTDVWRELADVWRGIWTASDNHLTGITRQIATVWRK